MDIESLLKEICVGKILKYDEKISKERSMEKIELLKYIRFFRRKLQTNKLIVFVGAGVSKNVEGMPSWYELIVKMAESINFSKCKFCDKKRKGCKECCDFSDEYSNDEFLKIPQYVYNRSKKLYNKVLKENIDHDRSINAPLSDAIFDLAPSHIITTNYDKLIENCNNMQADNYEVIIHDKDLLNTQKNKYIIKMHGDIDDLDTIVLKEADFLDFSQNHVLIEMFVKALLTDHTILFLGYSVNDYNIKLIINWINHIRKQNKAIDKETKFGYMIVDNKKISKLEKNYFEKNNIGVINLRNIPIINNIPHELTMDVGKRLYSFLKIIADKYLELFLGEELIYQDAVQFMQKYKYIDGKNICKLLSIRDISLSGHELFVASEIQYDSLIKFLKSESKYSDDLHQILFNAGIYTINLATLSKRHNSYVIASRYNTIFDNEFYSLYITNKYLELNRKIDDLAKESIFESCFYKSLIKNYTSEVFKWYDCIKYEELSEEQKVQYLFNLEVLKSRKTYQFNGRNITKYIDGIADLQERQLYDLYQHILRGNHQKLFDIEKSLNKLKDQYYNTNHTFLNGGSLNEFFKIKRVSVEQYLFYFNNLLFLQEFSDLKKFLKVYIEAIICINGNFEDFTTNNMFGFKSIKERYAIEKIDFDIITKFISTKELNNLLKEYKVDKFVVNDEFAEYIVDCFENIACSMVELKLYNRFLDVPHILVNCSLMLLHIHLNEKQRRRIGDVLLFLMNEKEFVEFFFSIDFPEFSISSKIIDELLKVAIRPYDIEIVKNIICNPRFNEYYINSNVRNLQSIFSSFVEGGNISEIQGDINELIVSFSGKERIIALRLLYKHITNEEYIKQHQKFISENFVFLKADDIFDFTFDNWLVITEEHEQKIITDTLELYNQQQLNSGVYKYPDPLKTNLELVCILYITENFSNINALKDLMCESVFLQFFIDGDNFNFSKVDFSNYMWENIARHSRFMDIFVVHKKEIIPNIQHKIDSDIATEFEKKILYGYLMDEEQLLK